MALDRNGLQIIDERECWRLLESRHLGRLAVSISGRQEVFPMNYVVDRHEAGGPSLVFRSAPGAKLAGAVLGADVAFEIDHTEPVSHTGWSVVAHGTALEITTMDELLRAEGLPLRPWGPSDKRHFVRIVADSVTGRRILLAGSA